MMKEGGAGESFFKTIQTQSFVLLGFWSKTHATKLGHLVFFFLSLTQNTSFHEHIRKEKQTHTLSLIFFGVCGYVSVSSFGIQVFSCFCLWAKNKKKGFCGEKKNVFFPFLLGSSSRNFFQFTRKFRLMEAKEGDLLLISEGQQKACVTREQKVPREQDIGGPVPFMR